MDKANPLTIETLSGKENEEHLITSPKAIAAVLHGIAESGAHAILYYDNAKDFILTSVLKANESGLWLEHGQNASGNRAVASSQNNTFVSSDYKIKVQFSTGPVKEVDYQGEPALYLPLPKGIYRLQRRDYFRLAPVHPLTCIIPTGRQHKSAREVPILDISGGGLGLACIGDDSELTPGNTYSNCQVNLPEIGTIIATIAVKNLVTVGKKLGHELKRAGCEFEDIDRSSSILLQRYVTNMQRAKLTE